MYAFSLSLPFCRPVLYTSHRQKNQFIVWLLATNLFFSTNTFKAFQSCYKKSQFNQSYKQSSSSSSSCKKINGTAEVNLLNNDFLVNWPFYWVVDLNSVSVYVANGQSCEMNFFSLSLTFSQNDQMTLKTNLPHEAVSLLNTRTRQIENNLKLS